jgi:hypothetical protein
VDARRFVGEWNERQTQRSPLLFSPTIGAAIAAQHWFAWVRCPGCCTTQSVDLRRLDRHADTMITGLIPSPSAAHADRMRLSPSW